MRATTRDVRGLGRIVRGQVSSSGGIVSGTGFTVVRTGLGLYTVTFTPAFLAAPVVLIGLHQVGFCRTTVLAASFMLDMFNTGAAAADIAFDFVAQTMV